MIPTYHRGRGRPRNEQPRFPDVTQLRDITEVREPLNPPKLEMFAQAIVRHNGDIAKATHEVLDPLQDPNFTQYEQLPDLIKRRVKYLLNRAASDTVATREEVEKELTQTIRGADNGIDKIDAIRELCKMKGWYSPVEIHNTHELKVPDRIVGMSDADLDKMIELGQQARTTEPIEIECEEVPQEQQQENSDGTAVDAGTADQAG